MAHLRLLANLAESGRITRAAEMAGVSQPSASRLLAEIEGLIGHPIHERSGRGIALTTVGAALALRAQRIVQEMNEASAEVSGLVSGDSGHLRIGSVTAPAVGLVLPALRELQAGYPGITADVTVAPSALLCQELRAGRLDIVLGRPVEDGDADDFTFSALGTEPIALIVRRGHPLEGQSSLTLADLMGFDWVMPDQTSPLGRAVRLAFALNGGVMPKVALTTTSFLLTLTVVRQGTTIAPVSEAVADVFDVSETSDYVRLASPLAMDVGPYGLLTRTRQASVPALARLIDRIMSLANSGSAQATGVNKG